MAELFNPVMKLPPKPLGVFGPKQNPEATLLGLAGGAPLMLHSAKPTERFQKHVAKRRLQPHEVFALRRSPP